MQAKREAADYPTHSPSDCVLDLLNVAGVLADVNTMKHKMELKAKTEQIQYDLCKIYECITPGMRVEAMKDVYNMFLLKIKRMENALFRYYFAKSYGFSGFANVMNKIHRFNYSENSLEYKLMMMGYSSVIDLISKTCMSYVMHRRHDDVSDFFCRSLAVLVLVGLKKQGSFCFGMEVADMKRLVTIFAFLPSKTEDKATMLSTLFVEFVDPGIKNHFIDFNIWRTMPEYIDSFDVEGCHNRMLRVKRDLIRDWVRAGSTLQNIVDDICRGLTEYLTPTIIVNNSDENELQFLFWCLQKAVECEERSRTGSLTELAVKIMLVYANLIDCYLMDTTKTMEQWRWRNIGKFIGSVNLKHCVSIIERSDVCVPVEVPRLILKVISFVDANVLQNVADRTMSAFHVVFWGIGRSLKDIVADRYSFGGKVSHFVWK